MRRRQLELRTTHYVMTHFIGLCLVLYDATWIGRQKCLFLYGWLKVTNLARQNSEVQVRGRFGYYLTLLSNQLLFPDCLWFHMSEKIHAAVIKCGLSPISSDIYLHQKYSVCAACLQCVCTWWSVGERERGRWRERVKEEPDKKVDGQ